MASFIIHIAVAQELNKLLKRDNQKMLIGSIAPDIAKFIGKTKVDTHFQKTMNDLPNLNLFLDKYRNYLNDGFVLGYYIHLYTDYLWFGELEPTIYHDGMLYKLDNTTEEMSNDERLKYFYHDYTTLNKDLIKLYNINLDFLKDDIPPLNNIIYEYPYDKTNVILREAINIISNNINENPYVFNENIVSNFISRVTNIIYSDLKKLL